MKERYVKPKIYCENFTLSQTIARNCGDNHDSSSFGESNHYNESTCQWIAGDVKIFASAPCTWPDPEDYLEDPDILKLMIDDLLKEEYGGGVCYNNPESGQQLFSST